MLNFMILWIILNTHFAACDTYLRKKRKIPSVIQCFFSNAFTHIYCIWCVSCLFIVSSCVYVRKKDLCIWMCGVYINLSLYYIYVCMSIYVWSALSIYECVHKSDELSLSLCRTTFENTSSI